MLSEGKLISDKDLADNGPGSKKGESGGADGIRTHDLLDAIEARSQLRHGPTGEKLVSAFIAPQTRASTRLALATPDPAEGQALVSTPAPEQGLRSSQALHLGHNFLICFEP